MTDSPEPQPALFDEAEIIGPTNRAGGVAGSGPAERLLRQTIAAGKAAGTLTDVHWGMVGAALAAARSIDAADRIPSVKSGYLIAQLLTPYRETLNALGLPVAVAPAAADDRLALPTVPADASSLLRDGFGTASY